MANRSAMPDIHSKGSDGVGKPGVMIYFETGKAIKGLSYEEKGKLFEAILNYAEFGVAPEMEGCLQYIWPFVVDKIDRDSAKYEEIRQKRSDAGKKGGEARAENAKQKQANEASVSIIDQVKPAVAETGNGTKTITITGNETVATKTDASISGEMDFNSKRNAAIEQLKNYCG